MSQYIHIFGKVEGGRKREILLNTGAISRIEVSYTVNEYVTELEQAMKDPDAVRHYHVFIGGEEFIVQSNPDSPVMKVLEDIYKNAIKG